MDGTFVTVSGFNHAGNVEAFAEHIKKTWGADLAGVELRHIKLYGPWEAAQPKLAVWTVKLEDADAALAANVPLPTLTGAAGDYFFIACIPASPPAAASGASVLGARRALIFFLHHCCSLTVCVNSSPTPPPHFRRIGHFRGS